MNKSFIEVIWSGIHQVLSAELLKAWQIDYSKSVRDIQDYFQYKWKIFNTDLFLKDAKIIISDDLCGTAATSNILDVLSQPVYSNQISTVLTDGNFSTYLGIKQANKILTFKGRGYQINRVTNTNIDSIAFINETIFTGQTGLKWRVSPTLTTLINLEEEGVCAGDLLLIKITYKEKNATIKCRIISVNNNKAAFSFNLDIPKDGIALSGLSKENQLLLAEKFNISLPINIDGSLLYKDKALDIKNEIESIAWKRQFYEKELNKITILNEDIFIEPLKIVRNTKIKIDKEILYVPTLQEYIQQPQYYIKNNIYYRQDNNKEISKPLFFKENIDYYLWPSTGFKFSANIIANSELVTILNGDLIKQKVEIYDKIIISSGNNKGIYAIKEIVSATTFKIYPLPKHTQTNIELLIKRKKEEAYLIFTNPTNAIEIPNLWAEKIYTNNTKYIEQNFGSLVDITYEDFLKQNIAISYKHIVAGLMYCFSKGTQINTIKLGAAILLGLPFSHRKGTIVEINPTYKISEINGAPKIGRIIIEIENGDKDIYYYPRGAQQLIAGKWEDVTPDLSGVAINEKTKKEYVVGDIVEKYTVLCKGVEVYDYLTNSTWFNLRKANIGSNLLLTQYHTTFVRANTDLYGTASLGYVVSFLKKAKPTYIDIKAIAAKSFEDSITITDNKRIKISALIFDGIGLGLPPPILKRYSEVGSYINWNGLFAYRYLKGTANTTFNSNQLTVDAGLVSPRNGESHDSPFIRSGDLLLLYKSQNAGQHTIDTVTNDTTLSLVSPGNLQTTQQSYAIYRQIKNPLITGSITLTSGINTIPAISGQYSAGLSIGDYIYFWTNSTMSNWYIITAVNPITLNKTVSENGNYNFVVFRPNLIPQESSSFNITSNGTNWIQFSAGANNLYIQKDDDVVISNIPYKILDWKPVTLEFYIQTVIPAGNYTATIKKAINKNGINVKDYYFSEKINLSFKPAVLTTCTTTAGSRQVDVNVGLNLTTLKIAPGDFLTLLSGSDRVDIGYGLGYYPISRVLDNDTLELTRSLANNGTPTYSLSRIINN